MSAFDNTPWRSVRADSLEVEVDALDATITRLLNVVGLATGVEQLTIVNTIGVLERMRDKRRESAALLRSAA